MAGSSGTDAEQYMNLYRIAGDGSTREEYMPLYRIDNVNDHRWPQFVIGRGGMYYSNFDEEQGRLYRYDLDSKKQTVIFDSGVSGGRVYRTKIYGDFLFFQMYASREVGSEGGVYAYNFKTGETKLVLNHVVAPYSVEGGKIICTYGNGIYSYDLRSAELVKVIDITSKEDAGGFQTNSKYIVLGNFEVYTLSGEYVCKLALEGYDEIIGVDEEYILAEVFVPTISEREGEYVFAVKPISELDDKPFEEYECED